MSCNLYYYRIAPFFKDLSVKYANVVFLKVDVDKCSGTAAANNVSAMPTFVFFRNRSEIDRMRGADRNQLENKIKQHSTAAAAGDQTASVGIEGEFVIKKNYISKLENKF
jgi:thioredoxin-like negative regulator of GroEL